MAEQLGKLALQPLLRQYQATQENNVGIEEMKSRFVKIADKLNHSPVWNHTMLFALLYLCEMVVLVTIVIGKLLVGKVILAGAIKAWLLMTSISIVGWLVLGIRNYHIHKKTNIWKYYTSKTRNGKLID